MKSHLKDTYFEDVLLAVAAFYLFLSSQKNTASNGPIFSMLLKYERLLRRFANAYLWRAFRHGTIGDKACE